MPRAKPEDRMRKLEEQRARINAEIQRVRSRESQEERKRETRRKILAGAMVLDRVARKDLSEKLFKADMDRFLERDQDRALFDLPRKTAETKPAAQGIPVMKAQASCPRFSFLPGSCPIRDGCPESEAALRLSASSLLRRLLFSPGVPTSLKMFS